MHIVIHTFSYLCTRNEKDKDNRDEALDDRRVS